MGANPVSKAKPSDHTHPDLERCDICLREVTPTGSDRNVGDLIPVPGTTWHGHQIFLPTRGKHPVFFHMSDIDGKGKNFAVVKQMWIPTAYYEKVKPNAGEISSD